MKLVLFLLFTLVLGSCASEQERIQKTADKAEMSKGANLAYGGNCAMGMCHKKVHPGNAKHSVDYKGKRYLFTSDDARDKFISDIENNIKNADKEWASAAAAERAN
jgi:YHS domain-containing protein